MIERWRSSIARPLAFGVAIVAMMVSMIASPGTAFAEDRTAAGTENFGRSLCVNRW